MSDNIVTIQCQNKLTLADLAAAFCALDSCGMAEFFNAVGDITWKWKGGGFDMQMYMTTDPHQDGTLTFHGRYAMECIGTWAKEAYTPTLDEIYRSKP